MGCSHTQNICSVRTEYRQNANEYAGEGKIIQGHKRISCVSQFTMIVHISYFLANVMESYQVHLTVFHFS
jgi:hypothetical protein